MNLKNNRDFLTLQQELKKHTNRAYFVGGAVRDSILGIQTKDIDIEVYDVSIKDFEELMDSLGATGVGKSFFVYKYGNFDISLPRVETKVSQGHRGFEVFLTDDTIVASKRRDFSVNALMENIFTGEMIDHFGGMIALEKRSLKHIDNESFREDSLRVLRAIQFVARFDFSIDKETIKLCKSISLDDLSKERVYVEFDKFFKGENKSRALEYIFELEILEKIFDISLTPNEKLQLQEYMKNSLGYFDFLFFLREVSGKNIDSILEQFKAPKSFFHFFKTQPKIVDVKEIKDLLKLALKIPLGNWVGLKFSKFYKIAENLELIENKFEPTIRGKDLLAQGLNGKELGAELERKQLQEIEEFYGRKMGTTN